MSKKENKKLTVNGLIEILQKIKNKDIEIRVVLGDCYGCGKSPIIYSDEKFYYDTIKIGQERLDGFTRTVYKEVFVIDLI
jgi:hypothetical protein